MNIKDLGITNYRSFDSEGVLIEDLGRINIFIGKNNSGKSNILKYLKSISEKMYFLSEQQKITEVTFRNRLEDRYLKKGGYSELIIKTYAKNIYEASENTEYNFHPFKTLWNKDELLTFKINLFEVETFFIKSPIEDLNEDKLLKLKELYSDIPEAKRILRLILIEFLKKFTNLIYIPSFREISQHPIQIKIDNDIIGDLLNEIDSEKLQKLENLGYGFYSIENLIKYLLKDNFDKKEIITVLDFAEKFIAEPVKYNLQDMNELGEFTANLGLHIRNKSIDGKDIIEKLYDLQFADINEDKKIESLKKIKSTLKNLFDSSSLELTIPKEKDKIILDMYGSRLSLDSFGTGIHELIILCITIIINPGSIFCLEEPEIHLHPELQRRFLKFLEEEIDNTYFITTHSNVFLDYSLNKNIYYVTYTGSYGKKRTKIEKIDTNENFYQILDDLGYKASDILQSNGIIWVEGPSDRIYLEKWLSLVNSNFKEGIHYSIMFYSGRLLSHLSLEEEKNIDPAFINLLRINKNAIVLIDRDGDAKNAKINDTKNRIKSELGDNCIITKVREIENYLTEKTMTAYLTEKLKTKIEFIYDENKKLQESINYALEKNNYKEPFKYDKVKCSREIIDFIDKDDLKILDLDKNLEFIINSISKWNQIEIRKVDNPDE